MPAKRVRPHYIVVKSCPHDLHWNWYIVDTVAKVCIDRLSGPYTWATDRADRMNREANVR